MSRPAPTIDAHLQLAALQAHRAMEAHLARLATIRVLWGGGPDPARPPSVDARQTVRSLLPRLEARR